MSESNMPVRCVHCLQPTEEATKDHWLPRSWYPTSRQPDLELLSFPAHRACNQRYGQIEDRLRNRLALGLDPASSAAQGVVESVHRAINPEYGRDERNRAARATRREQLLNEIVPARDVPGYAVLPGFGPVEEAQSEEQLATFVSPDDLELFVEKLVRGLTYLQLGEFIEPGYEIMMQLVAPENAGFLSSQLDRFGETVDRSPAIRARVARAASDKIAALYEFTIWERLTIYATVRRRGQGGE